MDNPQVEPVIIALVLIGAFVVANGLLLTFIMIPTLKARRAQSWPTVTGQVESSDVSTEPSQPDVCKLGTI